MPVSRKSEVKLLLILFGLGIEASTHQKIVQQLANMWARDV